jgi:DNA-binding transcriptional MerR regulator
LPNQLDLEWVSLIVEAKQAGVTIQELQEIFQETHEFLLAFRKGKDQIPV